MIKRSCLIFLFLACKICHAQLDLQCDNRDLHSVYIISSANNTIYRVDSVDTNPTGLIPVQAVPPLTYGISINPNLDSVAGPTTMYYVNNAKEYYFWNGAGWSNTGHTSGGFSAVNPGGTSSYIFNYGSNLVYRYDGTSNGTILINLLTAKLPDVATDKFDNFYLCDLSTQEILAYTFAGIPLDTLYVTGSVGPGSSCGGFALLGSRFYVESVFELHEGVIIGDTVHFSMIVSHPNISSNDIAVCPTSGLQVAVFNDQETPHFVIYPNPAFDAAFIRFNNTAILNVYDNMGVLQESIYVKGLVEYRLDLSKLRTGIYLIQAVSENNSSTTKKFIVQNNVD